MMRWPAVVITWLFVCITPAQAGDPAAPVSFRRQVAPILVAKCLGCHNEKQAKNGLNMATYASLRRGGKGEGAEILVPGDPAASGLIESIGPDASPRMPIKQPPLSRAEIDLIETWVRQGARFDGESVAETPIASLVDPLASLPAVSLSAPASEPVTALAFTPDGKSLVAAVGRSVVVVDPATGSSSRTLGPHPGPVTGVAITPDGSTIVAAGGRAGMFGFVTTWALADGTKKGEARGHTDSVLSLALAPDGRTAATGSYDRLVMLWDLAKPQPVATLRDHTDAVNSVAFSSDGKTLASSGADRTVKLWETATRKRFKTLSESTGELHAVALSPDGKSVIAAGDDRSVRVWSVDGAASGLVRSTIAHDASIVELAVSADGKTLVTGGADRVVKLWDLPALGFRSSIGNQPDWPQALALSADGQRLAVGRLDGSVAVHESKTGKSLTTFRPVPPAPAVASAKPALVRNATLNPPLPRGATRGQTVRLTLTGESVGRSVEVLTLENGLSAKIIPSAKPEANRLEVDLTVAGTARVGVHRIGVVTPAGIPPFQPFAIEAHPGANEVEPNDDPTSATPIWRPATIVGTIDKPGDVDVFRFDAKAGEPLVFAMNSKALGSTLNGSLAVLAPDGRVLADSTARPDGTDADPAVTFVAPSDGSYLLRVSDLDYEGTANHFYRIAAGNDPLVEDTFPLGAEAGKTGEFQVNGVNIGGKAVVPFAAPAGLAPGTIVELPLGLAAGLSPVNRPLLVVAEGPQTMEPAAGSPEKSKPLAIPGGVSGRISMPGEVDTYDFAAKKGQPLVFEVFARRLGSPIDTYLEIVDSHGKPVTRALLRQVAQTEVAFRDHNASVPGIRLTAWGNLAMNDTVLIGREVTRILALPRNPDDDCLFWSDQGVRVGLLGTTPEHHPMAQPIYKVDVLAPDAVLPPGSASPVRVDHRNDDGGPEFGKDSYLAFEPPADGDYRVRVGDARALGGSEFRYHLVARRPRPDFAISVAPENPSIPRGSTTLLTVRVHRRDGFEAPVSIEARDLPSGVHATPALVERGMTTAILALTADPDAPQFSPPTWTLKARALPAQGETGPVGGLERSFDPMGSSGGRVTVTAEPNLTVTANPKRVEIKPGGEATLTLSVARSNGFAGRVPIEVKNLPHGVRVLDIGLNGVLVTEKQSERSVRLYAEPWVTACKRPFFAAGKAESAGTEDSSAPVTLVVTPERTTAQSR